MTRVEVVHGAALDSTPALSSETSFITRLLEMRSTANAAFFAAEADRIAALCSSMADRLAQGGRLIAIGLSAAARSDVRHVAVEFVHPVIVGKRALPAIGLTDDADDLAAHVGMVATPRDIVLAFPSANERHANAIRSAIAAARDRGCLTIAVDELGADVEFRPVYDDPFVWQELVETLYHVLWELVHVFFEHGNDRPGATTDPGRSAFLYPFLTEAPRDIAAVTRDVAQSVRAKAAEIAGLRQTTLSTQTISTLERVGALVRDSHSSGGKVLAFGNGGSATDAMDLVADLRSPPSTALCAHRALDLTEDSSILTALANDVSPDVMFARQIIAYGAPGDVAIGFSTSGSSRNIVAAFAEARRRGLVTVAFTGYDGGQIAADGLADHVIVAPSQYVPRIQEAHATAYHVLRALIG